MPYENPVDQFTAQVERFVQSPYVNAPEPVAQFVAAVGPRPEERAIDVACGPGLLARSCLRCDGRSWWRRGARGDIKSTSSTRALRWEIAEEYAALVTAW